MVMLECDQWVILHVCLVNCTRKHLLPAWMTRVRGFHPQDLHQMIQRRKCHCLFQIPWMKADDEEKDDESCDLFLCAFLEVFGTRGGTFSLAKQKL